MVSRECQLAAQLCKQVEL